MRASPARSITLSLALALTACAARPRAAEVATATSRVVRVAACQIAAAGELEAALAAVDAALAEAARGGADVACFPETCLLGWVNPVAHERADPIPGATTERLGALARRHGVMIAIGLAERDGERLHDSVVLIDRDGRLLLRHRKVNVLSELMDPPYAAGTDARESVVDTRLGRIGLLVCADTFVDEIVADVAAAEPDLVLVPYGWAAPDDAWPEHGESLRAWVAHTARRTGAPVVGVDGVGAIAAGPWRGYPLGGQSVACDRDGAVLGVLADRAPEVRVLAVELAPRGAPPHAPPE